MPNNDSKVKSVNENSEPYGWSLLLSFHDVDDAKFDPKFIKQFGEELVDHLGMVRGPFHIWGSLKDENDTPYVKSDGLSAVQFLMESAVTSHFLDEIHKVYVDIFSCKEYDSFSAIQFCQDKIGGRLVQHQSITRL